jgi:hypothetical protein
MGKVQKPNNSECYTRAPLAEAFITKKTLIFWSDLMNLNKFLQHNFRYRITVYRRRIQI